MPSRPARMLLSAWFLFHFLMLTNYVWIDESQKRWLRPISKPYVEWLQLTQKWHMFRNPARSDIFIGARACVRAADPGADPSGYDCTEVPGLDKAPPPGPFSNQRYDRMVKVHNILAYEDDDGGRYAGHYARWLCGQVRHGSGAAPDLVQVYRREVRHRSFDEWREGFVPAETRTPFVAAECAP